MRIEKVTEHNIDVLFEMVCQMVDESFFAYAKPCRQKIVQLMHYPKSAGFLAYQDDTPIGFIAGIISPFFFSQVQRANDLGFYIYPPYRGTRAALLLLHALEDWAKMMGEPRLYMGHSVGGKTEQMKLFFIRNGYRIGGFNSVKEL